MTCPGCDREVTLINGYCGHCSTAISKAVETALDDLSVIDAEVHDLGEWQDGFIHIRLEQGDRR